MNKINGSLIELTDMKGNLILLDLSKSLHIRREQDPNSRREYCVTQFSFDAQSINETMKELIEDILPPSMFVENGGTFMILTDSNGFPSIVNFAPGSFQTVRTTESKGSGNTLIQHNPKNFMYVRETIGQINKKLPDEFFVPEN